MADITFHSDPLLTRGDVTLPSAGAATAESAKSSWPAITFIPRDGSAELHIPLSAHTLDGFREWAVSEEFPDRGRFTFVAGELIIDMSPEYLESHNFLKTEITSAINLLTRNRGLGRVFGDRCLFSNEAAGISTEPDALFVSGSSWQSGKCHIRRGSRPGVSDELVGSPDWILEVLSPSSMRKDKKLFFEAYFRAGVAEYWLIDALGDEIDFQMLTRGADSFVPVQPQASWLASPTFGCAFQLTRQKAEDGLWEYTLHVQEES